jgi:ribosomal protein S18 acetylase RimI-like enzyme
MFSVSPLAQGIGIAKKMLAAADDYARKHNCSSIYMTVISVREELIAWYERHGYEKNRQSTPLPC